MVSCSSLANEVTKLFTSMSFKLTLLTFFSLFIVFLLSVLYPTRASAVPTLDFSWEVFNDACFGKSSDFDECRESTPGLTWKAEEYHRKAHT
jgi:hypothetical protein